MNSCTKRARFLFWHFTVPNHCFHSASVQRPNCVALGETDLVWKCCRCGHQREWDL